jgi:hypothetical protein
MALSARQIIDARVPRYVGNTRVDTLLALCREELSVNLGERGVALLALHYLTLEEGGALTGAAGPIVSERQGDLQTTYAVDARSAARWPHLVGTQYGRELIGLIKARPRMFNQLTGEDICRE